MRLTNVLFSSDFRLVGFLRYYALALIIEVPVVVFVIIRNAGMINSPPISLPGNLLLGLMGLFLVLEVLNLTGTIAKGHPFWGLVPIICIDSLTVPFQFPAEVINRYLFPFCVAIVVLHIAQWIVIEVRAGRKMPVPTLKFSTPERLTYLNFVFDITGGLRLAGEFFSHFTQ